jgi:hypothetical protein
LEVQLGSRRMVKPGNCLGPKEFRKLNGREIWFTSVAPWSPCSLRNRRIGLSISRLVIEGSILRDLSAIAYSMLTGSLT